MNLLDSKFSLILASVDRTDEIERFLAFLDRQTYRNFELIVVDQNEDDRLGPILASYRERFPVYRVRSPRGLSRARNVGLKHASGDIIAFPDDDCYYPAELLANVADLLSENPQYDGVTGISVGEIMFKFDRNDGRISVYNVWNRAISFTIFLRSGVVGAVGDFDESLGLGAGTRWGSAEETDYLVRAVALGKYLYFSPRLEVGHARMNEADHEMVINRVARYAPGIGYVLKKHAYPLWFLFWCVARSFAGSLLALASGKRHVFRERLTRARGIVAGWLGASHQAERVDSTGGGGDRISASSGFSTT